MFFVRHRTFFLWLTGAILAAAVGAIAFWGLPLSIDFTGGSLVEVAYEEERPALAELREHVEPLVEGEISLRESGTEGVVLRTPILSPEQTDAVVGALSLEGAHPLTVLRSNSIGPALGAELATKSLWAMLAVILGIVLYIAFAFRKVSRPVPSWGYGLTVVVMFLIDIIVPTGFYAAWAHFTGAQVDVLFVVALLALMGYVVNDVIVIFDRIRERLRRNEEQNIKEAFDVSVGKSIDETIVRSINTSLTVALALIAIFFFGPEVTRNFALVILVGVVIGAFSSIARSAPLLIPIAEWFAKRKQKGS